MVALTPCGAMGTTPGARNTGLEAFGWLTNTRAEPEGLHTPIHDACGTPPCLTGERFAGERQVANTVDENSVGHE